MSYEINRRLTERRGPLETGAEVDAVTAGIIRGAFETICYEVATHLGRCASSAIINQSNERNGSIIDGHGRLAGISVGIPQLLFISPMAVRWGLEHFETDAWGPGDVFVGNDPDHGGGHLPDYTVYAPMFDDEGRVLAIQALQAHQGDTGGKDPGGFSVDAMEIYAEGLIIPRLKLAHRGELRKDVVEMIVRNNRLPSFPGDIAAMISATQLGAEKLAELCARYGADTVKAAINFNIAETERRFREEVARWPDGTYEGEVLIDHDTAGTPDVKVRVACRVEGDQLTLDMTGSDDRPELVCVWNTFSNTRGYAMAQLASMVDPTIPKNEGLFDAVEMIVPEGLDPPAAAQQARHPRRLPSRRGGRRGDLRGALRDPARALLAPGLQDRHAQRRHRLRRAGRHVDGPGRGRPGLRRLGDPGPRRLGAMCSGLGNLILASAEEAESRFPVINLSREMTADTGGAGRWRGQPGTRNVKQVLEPFTAVAWMVSMRHPLRGLRGGDDAAPYSNVSREGEAHLPSATGRGRQRVAPARGADGVVVEERVPRRAADRGRSDHAAAGVHQRADTRHQSAVPELRRHDVPRLHVPNHGNLPGAQLATGRLTDQSPIGLDCIVGLGRRLGGRRLLAQLAPERVQGVLVVELLGLGAALGLGSHLLGLLADRRRILRQDLLLGLGGWRRLRSGGGRGCRLRPRGRSRSRRAGHQVDRDRRRHRLRGRRRREGERQDGHGVGDRRGQQQAPELAALAIRVHATARAR